MGHRLPIDFFLKYGIVYASNCGQTRKRMIMASKYLDCLSPFKVISHIRGGSFNGRKEVGREILTEAREAVKHGRLSWAELGTTEQELETMVSNL